MMASPPIFSARRSTWRVPLHDEHEEEGDNRFDDDARHHAGAAAQLWCARDDDVAPEQSEAYEGGDGIG